MSTAGFVTSDAVHAEGVQVVRDYFRDSSIAESTTLRGRGTVANGHVEAASRAVGSGRSDRGRNAYQCGPELWSPRAGGAGEDVRDAGALTRCPPPDGIV